MADRTHYRYNDAISPETKYMHLMEAIEEAKLMFLLARIKGRTFTVSSIVQSKISSKRLKNE